MRSCLDCAVLCVCGCVCLGCMYVVVFALVVYCISLWCGRVVVVLYLFCRVVGCVMVRCPKVVTSGQCRVSLTYCVYPFFSPSLEYLPYTLKLSFSFGHFPTERYAQPLHCLM